MSYRATVKGELTVPSLLPRHRRVSDARHLHERPLHQLGGLLPLRVPAWPGHRRGWESVRGHAHEDHLLRRHQDGHVLAAVPRGRHQVRVLLRRPRARFRGAVLPLPLQELR